MRTARSGAACLLATAALLTGSATAQTPTSAPASAPAPAGDPNAALCRAAAAGDAQRCQSALQAGADPRWRGPAGRTALHWAALRGNDALVTALLAALQPPAVAPARADPGDLFSPNYDPNRPAAGGTKVDPNTLAGTSFEAYLASQKRLAGVLNAVDENGATPLHLAVGAKHGDVAKRLLDAGAPPDLADKLGLTPLHQAAIAADVPFVRLLLDRGADPKVRDAVGLTPAQVTENAEILAALQAASSPALRRADLAPLHALAERYVQALLAGDMQVVRQLSLPAEAARMPQQLLPPVQTPFRVLRVATSGAERGEAEIWLKVPERPAGRDQAVLRLNLQRGESGWRVAQAQWGPYWPDSPQKEDER
jgi:uncharacterized protein